MSAHIPWTTGFDKVVLITGGSKGIGDGCARVFVAAGATVVICARGREAGQALATELTGQGPGECTFETCDMNRPDDFKALIDSTVARHGRLDVLINNAGWHPPHKPIDDFSIQDFEGLLRLNLVSYFAGCKFALPHLRKTRGCIVNISSLVGSFGQEWAVTYVATKGGITALTKALAVDEARNGVRVNAILPGAIETPLVRSFIDSKPNAAEVREFMESWQWNGRLGTAEEVGYACLFLASDQASFITGIELPVTGGAELAYGVKMPGVGGIKL